MNFLSVTCYYYCGCDCQSDSAITYISLAAARE